MLEWRLILWLVKRCRSSVLKHYINYIIVVLQENSAISTPILKGWYSIFWVTGADTTEFSGSRHHHNRLHFRFISLISYSLPSRTWTGTLLLARDFKSPVSTYSTTGSKLFSLDGQSRTATHVCICHRLSTYYVYQFHHIEIVRAPIRIRTGTHAQAMRFATTTT